ncbi:MAG TPA: hypothetical protein VGM27_11295 [Acidobacteriaceae bacterium]
MEQRSKHTETTDASRVEHLLGLLRGLPQHDPSPALRERLELLSSKRFKAGAESRDLLGKIRLGLSLFLKPVTIVALVLAIGIVAAFIIHVHRPEPLHAGIRPPVAPSTASPGIGIRTQQAAPSTEASLPRPRRLPHRLEPSTVAQRMIVRLPYSDSAIITGTDATIRVSMSQAELMSLGFPINATLHDRRVVAELTLGDDGLPRAISVPLPLEIVREKK